MKFSILFGGEATISTTDTEVFKDQISRATGIKALQKSDETQTVTFDKDAVEVPENIRGDWMAVAEFLIAFAPNTEEKTPEDKANEEADEKVT